MQFQDRFRTKEELLGELNYLRQRLSELEHVEDRYQYLKGVLQDYTDITQQFQEKLKALHSVTIELDKTETFDALCYEVVRLGRKQLGFDRLGVWFLDETRTLIQGSFGTDETGNIFSEKSLCFPPEEDKLDLLNGKVQIIYEEYGKLYDNDDNLIGYGWKAAAPLLDGNSVIGFIHADNLLTRKPLTNYELEILKLYGASVGYLARSKRSNEKVGMLSSAVEHSSSLVIITDPDGLIEYVNPKFTEVTGYTPEEVIGHNPRILKSGERSKEDYQDFWHTIKSGHEWSGEFPNRKKDGEFYWAFASVSPITDADGIITHFVAVQEDITGLKKADQQRLELTLERERVNILADFITHAAHEFRTPLSVINANVYIMKKMGQVGNEVPQLDIVSQQTAHITQLVESMLLMTRLDSEKTFPKSDCDVNHILKDLLMRFIPIAEVKQIKVVDNLGMLPPILANEMRLHVAFKEVIENALIYTDPGGAVTVLSMLNDNNIVVEISDTGHGIPEDELNYIFDRFYRGDTARTTRGTGLGLSIAYQAIHSLSGEIEVETSPGQGSIFRVLLPVNNP